MSATEVAIELHKKATDARAMLKSLLGEKYHEVQQPWRELFVRVRDAKEMGQVETLMELMKGAAPTDTAGWVRAKLLAVFMDEIDAEIASASKQGVPGDAIPGICGLNPGSVKR